MQGASREWERKVSGRQKQRWKRKREGFPLHGLSSVIPYVSSLKCIFHHSSMVNRHIIALKWYYEL